MHSAIKYTMKSIYGNNAVFSARPSFQKNPWMPKDKHLLNFLSVRETLIADIPILVHRATQTSCAKHLYQLAHLLPPDQPYQFIDEISYNKQLSLWQQENKTVVVQYWHAKEEIEPCYYWMSDKVFHYLNDKSYLQEIVPADYLPKRCIVPLSQLKTELANWNLPVVLKNADNSPTAGGYGVIICYHSSEVQNAITQFNTLKTPYIIIEEFLSIKQNYCVQFVKTHDNQFDYLGTSIQLTDKYGHYDGNVMCTDVPESVIQAGRAIMEKGIQKGFIGIAGFDIALTNDGKIRAFDLNFRQNGSTTLLLYNKVLNKPAQKFFSYTAKQSNQFFYKQICQFIKEEKLLPLSYYDGDFFEKGNIPSRFGGIWQANSYEDIAQWEQLLY